MNPHDSSDHLSSQECATRLIALAARRAPMELSERLQEEWLADLEATTGSLARLRLALGCCWATLVIGRDRVAVAAPVARAASVQGGALAGHQLHDGAWLSRRTIALTVIVGLHVVLIGVIGSGLGTTSVARPPVMHGTTIEVPRVSEPPPPLALRPADFTGVRPEIPFPAELHFPPPPISNVLRPSNGISTADETPALPVKRTAGGPGTGFPSAEAFYPTVSRQLREMGAAVVRVCVDERGGLSADPSIADSSGSARLDAGALALAKAGSGHYRAATDDGQPVASCFPFRIRFSLR